MATAVPFFIMQTDSEMWEFTLNMAIASYLSKKPNRQVKEMAKRYRKSTANLANKRTLRTIIKSSKPALVVQLTYEDLIS